MKKQIIPHSLMDDGIPSCFADNQIRPLHNDNAHKECCVACVLQFLPVTVRLQNEEHI